MKKVEKRSVSKKKTAKKNAPEKKVERVTTSEIQEARKQISYNTQSSSTNNKNTYISKLEDKKIKSFFIPLGYIAHERFNEEQIGDYIIVLCNDFTTIFNDMTVDTTFEDNSVLIPEGQEKNEFKFDDFIKYCALTGITPEQIIAKSISTNLFAQRFTSYAKDKKKFDEANIQISFRQLPSELKNVLSSIREQQEASITSEFNKTMYGYANIEEQLRQSY